MTSLRAAAPVLLLAAVLAGCDSGTSTTGGTSTTSSTSTPAGPADLAQVRDTCVTKTADALKGFTDKLTADQFFDLPADEKTLRVVTPAPVQDLTRAFALSAAQCAFREAGAPTAVVNQLSVPANGAQSGAWTGFTGEWESDATQGFRASVAVAG